MKKIILASAFIALTVTGCSNNIPDFQQQIPVINPVQPQQVNTMTNDKKGTLVYSSNTDRKNYTYVAPDFIISLKRGKLEGKPIYFEIKNFIRSYTDKNDFQYYEIIENKDDMRYFALNFYGVKDIKVLNKIKSDLHIYLEQRFEIYLLNN